jgi:small nuclear ribonucleoprotein (snRNP)-like protein
MQHDYLHRSFYTFLLVVLFAFTTPLRLQAQCGTGTTSAGTIIPDTSWQTISTSSGTYLAFEATAGVNYVFSFCSNGGAFTEDPFLTITDESGKEIISNNDFCNRGSQITWKSEATGTYRVHHEDFIPGGSCSNFNITRTLAYTGTSEETSSTSGTITTIAGNGKEGYSGDGSSAINAELNAPNSIAVDASGNVYIADTKNNRVRKVGTNGIITTVAGTGVWGYSGDGGPAINAQLSNPEGIAVDASGNLYIADSWNHRVRKVTADGIITTIIGTGDQEFGGDGDMAIHAKLAAPRDLVFDKYSNLYIADSHNSRIRKVDTNGIITTVAGNGTSGDSGDGGPATDATLYIPSYIEIDLSGNLYIPSKLTHTVRKVNSYGIISTIAGIGDYGYSGDGGPASTAALSNPCGIAVDDLGNVFIADASNYRIRKININNIISTFAGGGSGSGEGVPPTSIWLNGPHAVEFDASGNMYIADTYNHIIRKISYSAPSTNANLSALTLSEGTLSPAFTSGTISYTATVDNIVSSITLTPTIEQYPATITVNGTPVANGTASSAIALNVGSNNITVVVTAEDGKTTKTYTINVTREANTAPVLSTIGNKAVNELDTLNFITSATDSDAGQDLTYALVSAPTGAKIDSVSGAFSWTPTEAQGPASFTFKVRATDNGTPALFAEQEFTVTVNEVNLAPVITSVPDSLVKADSLYSYQIVATDTDLPANTLTYTAQELPSWLNYNTTTRTLSGTPGSSHVGEHQVKLTVSDGAASTDQVYAIKVEKSSVTKAAELKKNQVLIYPNPTAGQIALDISNLDSSKEIAVKMTSPDGRTIVNTSGKLKAVTDQLNITLSEAPVGMYILQLVVDKEVHIVKVVKQ